MKTKAFLLVLALAFPAFAQHQLPPGADPSQFKPLVERKDVVSWKTLAQVDLVKMKAATCRNSRRASPRSTRRK